MQTFLPNPSFHTSATILDRARLGKQRVEAKQIYLALTIHEYRWKNHPAVRMWKGYENALLFYGLIMCRNWKNRGYKDSLHEFFYREFHSTTELRIPWWLGNKDFHASHRSNLLRKDFNYYSKFNWKEGPELEYYWPV